jgi:hypothetical protein
MYKTYELYMEGQAGPLGFEPVTCRSDEELMAAVRTLIEARGLRAVEVRHFGSHVFTLEG